MAAAVRLHRSRHRRSEGKTLIEGPLVLAEAVAAGADVLEVFGGGDSSERDLAASADVPYRLVSERVLTRLAGTENPRGPVAVLRIPQEVSPGLGRLLCAWGVSDPGNCGTLLRAAAAFGYGFVAGPESADVWSPKVLRAAAGAHFRTNVSRVSDLKPLVGRSLVATLASGGEPPGPLPGDAVVLVGSEAHGLPADVVAECNRIVTVPMAGGTESLNAAVAGAIVAYVGGIEAGD